LTPRLVQLAPDERLRAPGRARRDAAEPGSSPRFRKQGEAEREPAIWHEGPIGPMRGDVEVVPVRRRGVVRKPTGDRDVYFEVLVRWGPTDDGRPVPGLQGCRATLWSTSPRSTTTRPPNGSRARAVDALRDPASWTRPPVELFVTAKALGVPLIRQLLT
jgi:hypothetical protein